MAGVPILAQSLPRCPLWLWRTGGSGRKDKKAVKGENWERRVPEEGPVSTKALEREQAGQYRGWAGGVDPGPEAISPRAMPATEKDCTGQWAALQQGRPGLIHVLTGSLLLLWAMDCEDGAEDRGGGW